MMGILIVCFAASIVIGTYTLATTPQELFRPAPGAWDTLAWPS